MNELLKAGWTWYPSVVTGFSLWTILYVWANRGKHTPMLQQIAFHLGTLAGLIALVSPLDELGDEYLFSFIKLVYRPCIDFCNLHCMANNAC